MYAGSLLKGAVYQGEVSVGQRPEAAGHLASAVKKQ